MEIVFSDTFHSFNLQIMTICKYILVVFLFLAVKTITAQDAISGYVTSETGEGIPFASIYLRDKNIGITSGINGHYRLPINFLEATTDTLIFSSVGYTTKRIPIVEFAKKAETGSINIVLTSNYILLSEVYILPNTYRPIDYGFAHLRSAPTNFIGTPSQRLMVFVENTAGITKIIQTVNIRLAGSNSDEIEKLRVFFYQKTESGFQNINVADEDIFITDFSQSRIQHDVSEHHIPFPAEGIFVGFEWIGEENVVRDRSRASDLGIRVTNRANELHSWISDIRTEEWLHYPPDDLKEALNDVPRMLRRMVRKNIINVNFSIGITAH